MTTRTLRPSKTQLNERLKNLTYEYYALSDYYAGEADRRTVEIHADHTRQTPLELSWRAADKSRAEIYSQIATELNLAVSLADEVRYLEGKRHLRSRKDGK